MHESRVVLVVVMAAVVPSGFAEPEAGEEDDRDDEHDPGDDGNPRRELEDLGGLVDVWRWGCRLGRRRSCGRSPRSWGFRCFTHETHDAGVNNSYGYALLM
jgi:hypothetical protein